MTPLIQSRSMQRWIGRHVPHNHAPVWFACYLTHPPRNYKRTWWVCQWAAYADVLSRKHRPDFMVKVTPR